MVKEVDEDILLISLEPTKYYQLWNKWDLYEVLLNSDKPIGFEVEDFPMELTELKEYAKKLMK